MMFFIVNKNNIMIVCVSLFLGVLAGFLMLSNSHATIFNNGNTPTIIIDAGHGIPDGGAVGTNGTIEQEINLKIANKIEEVLSAKGVNIIMTRKDKYGLCQEENKTIREMKIIDMKKRMSIMSNSNADLFISIHLNSFTSSKVSGLKIFYDKNHKEIKTLAESIQVRMADVTGAKTSAVMSVDRNLYLMKNSPIPSILIECGFISNQDEEKKLNEEDYQARLAWAIADAIEKYYALYIK